MRDKDEARLLTQAGGGLSGAAGACARSHSSMGTAPAQAHCAPTGEMRATLRDGLIFRGGRHLASLRDGVLARSFDGGRELFRGGLCFHEDVLRLAIEHGATMILATERISGQRYRVALADFLRLAWRYDHAVFGAQRGLELARWERLPKAGEPVQLGLFEATP